MNGLFLKVAIIFGIFLQSESSFEDPEIRKASERIEELQNKAALFKSLLLMTNGVPISNNQVGPRMFAENPDPRLALLGRDKMRYIRSSQSLGATNQDMENIYVVGNGISKRWQDDDLYDAYPRAFHQGQVQRTNIKPPYDLHFLMTMCPLLQQYFAPQVSSYPRQSYPYMQQSYSYPPQEYLQTQQNYLYPQQSYSGLQQSYSYPQQSYSYPKPHSPKAPISFQQPQFPVSPTPFPYSPMLSPPQPSSSPLPEPEQQLGDQKNCGDCFGERIQASPNRLQQQQWPASPTLRKLDDSVNEVFKARIVGGSEVSIREVPYQVSVQFYQIHFCGGAVITHIHILTAAHCTYKARFQQLNIRAGSTYRDKGGILVDVALITEHPLFSPTTVDYDIAILKLKSKLPYNSYIRPVRLPSKRCKWCEGTVGYVAGWGITNETHKVEDAPRHLRGVRLTVLDEKHCQEAYGEKRITTRMMCVGRLKGGKDSCSGDSGGPLVIGGILAGVVSFGNGCARREMPGVYTNVSATVKFIKFTIETY